jgi:hypothetical protein
MAYNYLILLYAKFVTMPELDFFDSFAMYFESESGFRSCDIITTKFFPEHLRLHSLFANFSVP